MVLGFFWFLSDAYPMVKRVRVFLPTDFSQLVLAAEVKQSVACVIPEQCTASCDLPMGYNPTGLRCVSTLKSNPVGYVGGAFLRRRSLRIFRGAWHRWEWTETSFGRTRCKKESCSALS